MSPWWYVEIVLVLVAVPFLYYAKPRFPTPWERFQATFKIFEKRMIELGLASQKVTVTMGEFSSKVRASEGTHTGRRRR